MHLDPTQPSALGRRSVLIGAFALGACASAPDNIIGVAAAPETGQPPPRAVHRVFVMTTRSLDPDPSILFSSGRSDGLSFASTDVTIPPNHVPGEVERPDSLPPDPASEMTVVAPRLYEEQAFVASIEAALSERPIGDRHALVFVHGYNTTLAEALLRLGQFVEDSGYTGVPILFSWASSGRLLNYVYDLNSVLAARDDLIAAAEILARTRATAVDVVAHSMGNLLTIEAMRQAQLLGRFNETGRLRHVILASPDVDVDLFRRQLEPFPRNDRRFFVLISRDDSALRVSRLLAGGVPRVGAGDVAPLSEIGVTVIDLSAIRGGESSHSKFAESPEIVRLIGQRLSLDGPLETAGTPSLADAIAVTIGEAVAPGR